MIRAIRKKDNHLVIKEFGATLTAGGFRPYDSNIFEEVELEALPENWEQYKEIPLAMGTDLVRFVNQTTESTLDDLQAFGIVSKLKDFLLYCQQGRCNPFTRSTFNNTLQTLDKAFANGQKELIVGLVNKWAKTVRFEE
jgi:hypothetical protein